jgi:hypothetical protein
MKSRPSVGFTAELLERLHGTPLQQAASIFTACGRRPETGAAEAQAVRQNGAKESGNTGFPQEIQTSEGTAALGLGGGFRGIGPDGRSPPKSGFALKFLVQNTAKN